MTPAERANLIPCYRGQGCILDDENNEKLCESECFILSLHASAEHKAYERAACVAENMGGEDGHAVAHHIRALIDEAQS